MTGEGDATRKNYSSNNYITDGNDHKVSIGNLDAQAATQSSALTTHAALTTGTHGITGTIMGTSDIQEVSNKTYAQILTPDATNTRDIGTNTVRWKDLYLEGNADIDGTLNVEGNVTFQADITVQGTTTTINSAVMTVTDPNIVLNSGGAQAAADSGDAGFTVEMSDATNTTLGYDSTLTSRFHCGDVGSVSEIMTVGTAQTVAGLKTFSQILTPDGNGTRDIGLTGTRWKDLYLGGNADIDGTLNIQGAATFQSTITGNSSATLDSRMVIQEITTPATPATGYQAIYPKADGSWYILDDGGVETVLSAGGTASLTSTRVGYGSGSNALTGSTNFTFDTTNDQLNMGNTSGFSGGGSGSGIAIYDPGGGASHIWLGNSTSGSTATDGMFIGMDAPSNLQINNKEAGNMFLGTSNITRMTILSGGNIGIGESSPDRLLHITNATSTATAETKCENNTSGHNAEFGITGTTYTPYGALGADEGFVYSTQSIGIMSDNVAGIIKFSTGGNSETMRLDASGYLGIGGTPSTLLTIQNPNTTGSTNIWDVKNSGGNNRAAFRMDADNLIFSFVDRSNADILAWNETTKFVAVGNSSPQKTLHVGSYNTGLSGAEVKLAVTDSSSHCYMSLLAGTTATNCGIYFGDTTEGRGVIQYLNGTDTLQFYTAGGVRMQLSSTGNMLLNTSTVRNSGIQSIDYPGSSAGGMGINDTDSANGSTFIGFLTGGTYRGGITNNNNTAVAYNLTSDARLKDNFRSIPNPLETLMKIKPREFEWKETGYTDHGFIAQELKEAYHYPVSGDDSGDPKINPMQVEYSKLIALQTAAIQELTKRVEELENGA